MVKIAVDPLFSLEAEAALPAGAPAVVLCHPHPAFGGRMDTPVIVALADACRAVGWGTVRFNFRGLGGSGGVPTGGRREHEDVSAVAAWARQEGASAVALVGYSFGALMAARVVAAREPVAAYVGIGFPSTLVDAEREHELKRALECGCPWLFVSGDHDPLSERERLARWVRYSPQAELQLVAGQSHFFTGSAKDELVGRVLRFLKKALGEEGAPAMFCA